MTVNQLLGMTANWQPGMTARTKAARDGELRPAFLRNKKNTAERCDFRSAVPLWNEDKMKKMKLSLASIMVTKSCYTKNLKDVTEVLS